ncbi:MAG TPA: hydroxymethylbilane synthase [Chthoniobacterales bacterium]|nr:hydroxymethylbilane synthase [Chthoniobacterales bacterium]
MAHRQRIVLGTRGSELALAQSRMVTEQLKTRWAGLEIETKVIKTRGDDPKSAIADQRAGRKGLFTGEIERALVDREIDLAVHSAKDLPSQIADGTDIGAVLPRGPVEDVLITMQKEDLESLPPNAMVATGSVRRKHQLYSIRPDLQVVSVQGNVPTRLRKFAENKWHAIILARAGLERLGYTVWPRGLRTSQGREFYASFLSPESFLPAGGQGVIAMQIRSCDKELETLLGRVNDSPTRMCLQAEREFLRLLDADCNQPIGVLATTRDTLMKIRAQVFDDTAKVRAASAEGESQHAEKLAAELFQKIGRA